MKLLEGVRGYNTGRDTNKAKTVAGPSWRNMQKAVCRVFHPVARRANCHLRTDPVISGRVPWLPSEAIN